MKAIIFALGCLILTLSATQSNAGWVSGYGGYQGAPARQAHGRAVVAVHGGNLPSHCYAALNHGSYGHLTPCGCWAQNYVFGSSERLMVVNGRKVNLWLAWTWAQVFPRTTPHAGAVAVTPGHVVPIVGVPRPGYITVADSWQTHDVPVAGKVIVEPHR